MRDVPSAGQMLRQAREAAGLTRTGLRDLLRDYLREQGREAETPGLRTFERWERGGRVDADMLFLILDLLEDSRNRATARKVGRHRMGEAASPIRGRIGLPRRSSAAPTPALRQTA